MNAEKQCGTGIDYEIVGDTVQQYACRSQTDEEGCPDLGTLQKTAGQQHGAGKICGDGDETDDRGER